MEKRILAVLALGLIIPVALGSEKLYRLALSFLEFLFR